MAKKPEELKGGNLPGGITQEQLDKWKAEHEAYTIVLTPINAPKDGKSDKTAYFKKPDIDIKLEVSTLLANGTKGAAMQYLFEACHLGGDPEVSNDGDMRFACMMKLMAKFNLYQAELKNA